MSNHSTKTIDIADRIILNHIQFDRFERLYYYELDSISEFELEELAASLMAEDEDRAYEATGCDNPYFSKRMLPSLIDFMKNSSDRDNAYEFINQWKSGITHYFDKTIQEILDERIERYGFYAKYEGEVA